MALQFLKDGLFTGTLTVQDRRSTASQALVYIDGKRTNSTDGSFGELVFLNNGDSVATVAAFRDTADDKGSLVFQTQNGAAGFGTRLTIGADGNATFANNIYGNSSNTTEIGKFDNTVTPAVTAAIKRIRMAQGGEIHFGDTEALRPLGITEGNWDNFGDSDFLSIYGRSSIRLYSGATASAGTLRLTLDTASNFEGDVNLTGDLTITNTTGNAKINLIENSGGTQNAAIEFDQAGQNALYISTNYISPTDANRILLQPGSYPALTASGGVNGSINSKVQILGTLQADRNIQTPNSDLSSTAAPTNFGVYTSEIRLIETPNGGLKQCRVITDNYGEWILVGRFAASAMNSIANGNSWSSESGLDTGTAQNLTTKFSADFGDSYPTEVRIMGATDFTKWRDTRTVDFIYGVPEGRQWKYFFSGGATNGMTFVGPNHSGNNKFGWNINGSYDGFGRWVNPAQTSVGMSDANVTNPSAAYTTATTNAFNWDGADDAKITVSATRTFSGQDSYVTSGFGNDDNTYGFFDEYPSESLNFIGGVDFSSAAWVLIKLPNASSGGGGGGDTFWSESGTDIYNTNSGNVGIGETNPDLQLHIKNTATGTTGIAIENTNNAQNLDIDFYNNSGSAQGRIRYEEGAGAFNISPNVGSPNAMYINYSNNVGIGTQSPVAKLHIQGGDIGLTTGQKLGWLYNPTASTPDNNMYNYIKTANNGGVPASPIEISGSNWTSGNTAAVIFTHTTYGQIMTLKTGGFLGINSTNPGYNLDVVLNDGATNTVADVIRVSHTSTGTPASGLGAGIQFSVERVSSSINLSRAAIYGTNGTVAGNEGNSGDFTIHTRTDTGPNDQTSGMNEKFRITDRGNIGQAVLPITDPYITSGDDAEQWQTYQIGKAGVFGAYKKNNESMFGFNTYVAAPSGNNKAIEFSLNGTATRYYADRISFHALTSNATTGIQTQTETVRILSSSGNVGIGATNPTGAKLEVKKDHGDTWVADFHNISADYQGVRIRHDSTSGSGGPGSSGNSALVVDDQRADNMTTPTPTVYIKRSGANTKGLLLSVEPHAVTGLTVNDGGRVGVGTEAPDAQLEVETASYANTNAVANFINGNNPTRVAYDTVVVAQTDVASLSIVETPAGGQSVEQKLTLAVGDNNAVIRSTSTATNGMYVLVGATTSAPAYQTTTGVLGIRILNSGFVGIGANTPRSKLEIYRAAGSSGTPQLIISTGEGSSRDYSLGTDVMAAGDFAVLDGVTSTVANVRMRFVDGGTVIAFRDNNTTELGRYINTPTGGAIKRIRMCQGGEIHFGDTVASSPLGITEGAWDQFTDTDLMSIYARNRLNIYAYPGGTTISASFVSGTFTAVGDVVAYGSPSDKRLKENIKPIESALEKVSKLQGVTFDWKKSDSILEIKEDIGFIAQDVQKVIPELVRENEDGMLSMRHQGIAPILLEAIKELKAEIDLLKSKPCTCNKCNCKE